MTIDLTQAKTIFLAALEKPAPARAAYLDTVCAGDQPLRQRVEAMLRAHDAPGELLQRSPDAMLAATAGEATAVRAPTGNAASDDDLVFLAPPSRPDTLGRLDHYHIQRVVGKGGFGIVLKAFDEKLHRIVAIKVLAPELAASATARNRFIREARAAAAVTHEHVVAIHAIEETHRPPYLVMQFVDGLSLQEKLNQSGVLGLRETLRIGMQIAAGLAAAHKQGLIHRDIKPANILLENGVERVKITDFGLARAQDDASLTQSGIVAGTPMYMSPEQANGETVDHRSDLFSFGSVLYAMCSGRPPFRASGAMAVLKRVIDEMPTPVQTVNPDIPDWLAAIIARLHAKNPAERFQSTREVADLLGEHLAELQRPNPPLRTVTPPSASGVPTEADCHRAAEVFAPMVQPGRSRLFRSQFAGIFVGAAVGVGLGITDPDFVVGISRVPAWLGDDNPVWCGMALGLVAGAILGTIVGLLRWALLVYRSWEMHHGLRDAAGVRGPEPALTPAARRFAWGLILPIAAGVFVVVAVPLAHWLRGHEEIVLSADDPDLKFTIVGKNVKGQYLSGAGRVALRAGRYSVTIVCGPSRLIDSIEMPEQGQKRTFSAGQRNAHLDIEVTRGERATLVIKTFPVHGSIAGRWESDWGPVALEHAAIASGAPVNVTGSYAPEEGKRGVITKASFNPVQGTLQISFAEAWWNGTGSAELKLSADGNKLDGTWRNSAGESGIWTMIRVP